jgi:pimeloyl-ACP methyl ester carboxylesterase/DNA-binding winged helix-turn-helix (wHTH) protein
MRHRFGEFELNTGTRELFAGGIPVPVEPQVFDLLALLIENRGRVVATDELIASVWGGRIVSESAIAARISAARTAIGDDGKQQRWIRTIPRRGFRFAGEVIADGPNPRPAVPAAPAPDRQRIAFCRSADGTRIAYATSGAGTPLVRAGHWLTHLEHDWNSPVWQPQLERLGRSFRLVRYDQRGNGLSDWNASDFALDRFVDDLEAVVDAAGLDRFALYGASQGAPIAIAYAHRHPERVSHLILHGGYERGRLVRLAESERAQGEAILTLIRHGWGQPGSPFNAAFATLFMPGGSREQIDSLAELQRTTTTPATAAALRAAVDSFDVSGIVGELRVPTLVLHARDDGVQPLDQGRALAAAIPDAEFVMLESRNHVLTPQEPAWNVAFEAIERFVSGA